jgi:hypothetical protein
MTANHLEHKIATFFPDHRGGGRRIGGEARGRGGLQQKENCHGGLSGRSIPVRWRSILVVPESECPHPVRSHCAAVDVAAIQTNL